MTIENAEATTAETTETPAEGTPPAAEAPVVEGEAAEAPAEGAEAEKPAEATPEEQARATRMRAVEAAKREQLSMSAQRRQLEGKLKEIQNWHSHVEERERALSAREAKLAEFERATKEGDLDYLEKLGFSYEQQTQRYLQRNSPEGRAQLALEKAERLERELSERAQRETQAQQQQRILQETRAVATKLVEIVDAHADEFPELAEWPPERVAQEGLTFKERFTAHYGRPPTFDEAMQALHQVAKAEAEHRAKRSAQRSGSVTSGAIGNGKAATQQAQRANGQQQTTPSLGNSTSTAKATPPREMTEEEKDAFAIAELRKLNRGAAA